MTAPEISVVIPTFKRPVLVERAVRSVVNQYIKPSEIIVVDADPKKSARDIFYKIDACGAHFIYACGGGVASINRNIGARRSAGAFLAFLDDDDVWGSMYLKRAYDCVLASSDSVVISWLAAEVDGKVSASKAIPPGLRPKSFFTNNPGVVGSNIFINRSAFFDVGGFDESLTVSEDKDLLIRLLDGGHQYSVVEERCVIRRVDGDDHLSMEASQKFSFGIRLFYEKYRCRMSCLQRLAVISRVKISAASGTQPWWRKGLYRMSVFLLISAPTRCKIVWWKWARSLKRQRSLINY